MRHKIASSHFNRDTNQRQQMFKLLLTGLFTHGHLTTTKPRAKEIKRQADKLISVAQVDSVASRRNLHMFFGKRDIVNTLVERIAPAMKDRKSGFTRIEVVGSRRGDNSEMVMLSLMSMPETVGTLKSGKKHAAIAAEVKPAAKPVVAAKIAKVEVEKVAPVAKKAAVKAAPKKVAAKK